MTLSWLFTANTSSLLILMAHGSLLLAFMTLLSALVCGHAMWRALERSTPENDHPPDTTPR